MRRELVMLVGLIAFHGTANLPAEVFKPIRKLTYDPKAAAVDLLSQEARGKLRVRVIPQNEFRSRVRIENLTGDPLTVRIPKAVAAVHVVPKPQNDGASRVRGPDDASQTETPKKGAGQAVVGSFGPMDDPAKPFPHESKSGSAFTIPAHQSVMILLHSACAEHGKPSPFSRMTYQLKPLEDQIENKTLRKIVEAYDPKAMDPLAFQAAVWHLANGLSWQSLAAKTEDRGGVVVLCFTREQLRSAQRLVAEAQLEAKK